MLSNERFNADKWNGDSAILTDHRLRLDEDYFRVVGSRAIERHLSKVAELEKTQEDFVLGWEIEGEGVTLDVVAYDFPGFFAIFSGVLFLSGYSIRAGHHFSYRKCEDSTYYPKNRSSFLYKRKTINTFFLDARPQAKGEFETIKEIKHYLEIFKEKGIGEVRFKLHSHIARLQAAQVTGERQRLHPLELWVDTDARYTYLEIRGEDTPGFLFSMVNALNLQGIVVQRIQVQSPEGNQVDDKFWLTDSSWKPIVEKDRLLRLKSTAALIKQFSGFLPYAPNPDLALKNFYAFLNNFLSDVEQRHRFLEEDPNKLLSLMALVFGSGNMIFEEFARMQSEYLLPLLKNSEDFSRRKTKMRWLREMEEIVAEAKGFESAISALNRFKDSELFRIDLSHLAYSVKTFSDLSEELSDLAEALVAVMSQITLSEVLRRKGLFTSVGDGACVMALGKFGGRELGYASDLELVFIYREPHWESPSGNEVYTDWVKLFKTSFKAKSAGIFELDLRLRPHGESGPLASEIQTWIEYFNDRRACHDLERQALVKMRPVWGDLDLQQEVIAARDDILYKKFKMNKEELLRLRETQIKSHVKGSSQNAKYSPGGLVEIEYAVQSLQIEYGHVFENLRATSTRDALEALIVNHLLTPTQFEKMQNAYAFLRRLINALRMVRGNAKDLELPDEGSEEYFFLIRRMGYHINRRMGLVAVQFDEDLKIHLEEVHHFYNHVMKGEVLVVEPGLPEIMMGKVSEEQSQKILSKLGVKDTEKVVVVLRRLYDLMEDREALLSTMVLAANFIAKSPDPERVFLSLENLLINAESDSHYLQKLLYNPYYLEYIVLIISHSSFLTLVLINNPHLLFEVVDGGELSVKKNKEQFEHELTRLIAEELTFENKVERVREYRNREYIRLLIRDVYRKIPLRWLTSEISALTRALTGVIYHSLFQENGEGELEEAQAVIAMGKLGADELNYSSDIDIVFVITRELSDSERTRLEKLNQRFLRALTASSRYGQLFRVDTTLRPYGQQGSLISDLGHYQRYYAKEASGWEYQIWLKASVLIGDFQGGKKLIEEILQLGLSESNRAKVKSSVADFRLKVLKILKSKKHLEREVKSGPGGIRVVEFWVQSLMMENGLAYPEILTGNTLQGLRRIERARLETAHHCEELAKAYSFLRMVEHRLQIWELAQEHLLPEGSEALTHLAQRCGFYDEIDRNAGEAFIERYEKVRQFLLGWHERLYPGLLEALG